MRREFPILEFDPDPQAMIDPAKLVRPGNVPEHCVICFFQEVIQKVVKEHAGKRLARRKWEIGHFPLFEISLKGKRLAFFQPGVGAPMAAGLLEEFIAMGCRKFIACGGAGAVAPNLPLGHLVIPNSAVRDEGTSYHYLAPAREVAADPRGVSVIESILKRENVPYLIGKTWTTDAPYRETPEKVALRRQEGCMTVDMEAAAFFAVAQFRQVVFGQMLYAGDDLSGAEWNERNWYKQTSIRERLFWLAAEACLLL